MRLEGNDFIIEYNTIDHVVNESDDQGGIDICYQPSYRGIVIRYNRWSDIQGGTHTGGAAIRFDDMISGMVVYGNLFERCGFLHFGAVQIHGGKDNLVENNVFYNCLAAVSFTIWEDTRWQEHLNKPEMKKKLYEDVDITSDVYLQKYPELQKDIYLNANENTVKDNLIISCEQPFLRLCDRVILENNTIFNAEGKMLNAFCTAQELAKYGLKPIPVEKIGVKNNEWVDEKNL
jgi:hypothetical protein